MPNRKEIGLMLYWAEGDKTRKPQLVALTNTDPKMLTYFISWFRTHYSIDESKLRCRLYIWPNIDEIKAKEYWARLLAIPTTQFTKSYVSKSKPNVRKIRHNQGVCRVSYASKDMLNQILDDIAKAFF